jgi:L-seryl-tRNA(Ser) seleniumtransferase
VHLNRSPASAIPSLDRLLRHPALGEAEVDLGRAVVVSTARVVLEEVRALVVAGSSVPTLEDLARSIDERSRELVRTSPRPLINATGVILHTNLGRAPVSAAAAEAMRTAVSGYAALEFELESGERGARDAAVTAVLRELTGAEDALVVNNNAGATLLVVTALATGLPVLVARGELVEIGGGFRLPEVLAAGGAILTEVGTTNRTYASDYERALATRAAPGAMAGDAPRSKVSDAEPTQPLILRVHASNYRITGFHHRPELAELVRVAAAHGAALADDLGSGSLLDTARYGLLPEPRVQDSVAGGADVVTFSGDKLLGGPQAGVIVGKRAAIARLRHHPLARALRPGKEVYAGLFATLLHYLRGEAEEHVPVWRMIAATSEELAERSGLWRTQVEARLRSGSVPHSLELAASSSTVGGGSVPGSDLPTTVLVLGARDPIELSARLRAFATPVVARIERDRVMLDPRTVLPGEDDAVVEAVVAALSQEPR